MVIYLGDLLDEGSVALDSDYEEYFRRFNHVFQLDRHVKVSETNNSIQVLQLNKFETEVTDVFF